MSKNNNKPKPDDRSDNVEKLQNMIQDTLQNIDEAEDTMEFSDEFDKPDIEAKNKRRKEAIEGFRAEVKDESRNQQ